MIGLIGYQDDAIGFGLTGIQHIREVPPEADTQAVEQALEQLRAEVDVIIIPASLHRLVQEHTQDLMIIEIPEDNSSKQEEISALAKELLGVNI